MIWFDFYDEWCSGNIMNTVFANETQHVNSFKDNWSFKMDGYYYPVGQLSLSSPYPLLGPKIYQALIRLVTWLGLYAVQCRRNGLWVRRSLRRRCLASLLLLVTTAVVVDFVVSSRKRRLAADGAADDAAGGSGPVFVSAAWREKMEDYHRFLIYNLLSSYCGRVVITDGSWPWRSWVWFQAAFNCFKGINEFLELSYSGKEL